MIKKQIFTLLFPMLIFSAGIYAQYSGGSGTSGDPYQIATKADLKYLSENSGEWDKHFIQTADITFEDADFQSGGDFYNDGKGFSPIGNSTTSFSGNYDGNAKTISNLFINRPSINKVGLFGYIYYDNTIDNLGLINVDITGNEQVGALIGDADAESVSNCYSTGSISGSRNVGGLIGYATLNSLSDSYSSCTVTGTLNRIGGLVGNNIMSGITRSYSTGNVSGDKNVGGLAGENANGNITQSYSTGSVTGNETVGGFVGYNSGTVRNSYSTGSVTRKSGSTNTYFGGFCGNNTYSTIEYCYSTGDVFESPATAWSTGDKGFVGYDFDDGNYTSNFFDSEASNQSTATGATPKTTAEMQRATTFLDAGWVFTLSGDVWAMNQDVNSSYPFLRMEGETPAHVWLGTSGTSWSTIGDWSENSTPGSTDNVIVPNVTNDPEITGAQPVTIHKLNVNPGANITIKQDGKFTVNGSLQSEKDGITIKSGATGTGSLINNSDGVGATVEHYVKESTGSTWSKTNPTEWFYISHPVGTQTITTVLENAGFTDLNNAKAYDLYRWNEATDTWLNYQAGVVSFEHTHFQRGTGYLYAAPVSVTFTYSGELHAGEQRWENLSHSGSGGWHLLGNPYPSGIVATDTWTFTNIVQTPKVWNNSSQSYDDVSAGFIPANTAFFVQVDGSAYGGNNSLTIPFAARAHQAPAPKSSPQSHILLVAQAEGSTMRQQSIIRLEPDVVEGFDPRYDSRFLPGYAPQLFSTTNTDRLSTRTVPEITPDLVIPFSFIRNDEGSEFKIALEETTEDADLYLVDLLADVEHHLTIEEPYVFTSSADDAAERFELRFASNGEPTAINPPKETTDDANIYVTDGILYIDFPRAVENAELQLIDALGREMFNSDLGNGSHFSVPLGLNTGAYIVRLSSSDHLITKKIVIR